MTRRRQQNRRAQTAHLPLRPGHPDATVRLHPLLCGQFKGPPGWFLGPPGWKCTPRALGIGVATRKLLDVPIVSFLVEHPTAGAFLIDTGLHPTIAEGGLTKNFGRRGALGYRHLQMKPEQALGVQLRRRGIAPEAIKLIVMTHLHADHASGLAEFAGATVAVSAREWGNKGGALDGYNPAQLHADIDYRLLDFATEGISHAGFDRTLDLFGDGSVIAVYTPGHSPGHLSLILRLANHHALVTGDAIFTISALRAEAEPWRIHDRHRYHDSLAQIQSHAAQNPTTVIIPGHDMQVWQTLRPVY